MGTRMVIRGQLWYADAAAVKQSHMRDVWRAGLDIRRGAKGMPEMGDVAPQPKTARTAPFVEGKSCYDPQDELLFREVANPRAEDGWAPMGFWTKRWSVSAEGVVSLARAGHLDCAVRPGSTARFFRCRDERVCLGSELYRKLASKRT